MFSNSLLTFYAIVAIGLGIVIGEETSTNKMSIFCDNNPGVNVCKDSYKEVDIFSLQNAVKNFTYEKDKYGDTFSIMKGVEKRGDCEDYSLTWISTIGIYTKFNRITMYGGVEKTGDKTGHMFTVIETDNGNYLLDNGTRIPVKFNKLEYHDLVPFMVLENGNIKRK